MKTVVKKQFNYLLRTSYFLLAFALIAGMTACSDEDDDGSANDDADLVGEPGNPRFNLQFTNPDNVDLDLYVKTPNGQTIYYANTNADGGSLDVDCLCGDCPQGPNENVFWEDGTAPEGVYEYWVDYFDSCDGGSPSSDFTLRVLKNREVISTRTGTLSSDQSTVWEHVEN